MPNEHCECPVAGWCARHGIDKSPREHQICQGVNCTPQQTDKYWSAWEAGMMAGQRGGVDRPKEFMKHARSPERARSRGLGDLVSRGVSAVTGIKPCGGCKNRAAWLNHWFPASLPPVEPVRLAQPVRHLTFHVWPVAGFGAWEWNCDRLLEHASMFNGRRIVAIVVDHTTDSADAVKEKLKDFTDEFIVMRNDAKLREVVTWVPMLESLEKYQGTQDITFSCHTKGVRHRISEADAAGGSTIFRWASAMYETLLSDISEIERMLETSATVGSFRRYGTPQSRGWGVWHYSGSFFWWRNLDAFRRNWRYVPQRFYGTEAWPGLMFRPEESACVCCDNVSDLYKWDYWNQQIEPQLNTWRSQRCPT